MKKINLAIVILFFSWLPFSSFAAGNLGISSWQESTVINDFGKVSEVYFVGRVKNFAPNQVMTAFSVTFDQSRTIKINKVICDSKVVQFSFTGNALTVTFTRPKKNSETVALYFTYEEKYDKINKFLREEAIQIPDFAAGASARVIINFPGYLDSATLNPNVTKSGNSFIYSNIVPQFGVDEIIKLTPAQSVWDVNIKYKITSNNSLNVASINVPSFFQNGGQKVENQSINSSVPSVQRVNSPSNTILKFNTIQKEILVENKARISTGQKNRTPISRNYNDYLQVSADESILLAPILEQIRKNPKYQNLPLYAQIGKFVHEFIKYDVTYADKLPPVKTILQNPLGVCTEYATLYNVLARISGIPAVIVNGAACGEYDKCQGHSWNMIYYGGNWINVDATWDLMSGIVSSSHVYFSDYKKGEINFEYYDKKAVVKSTLDFEMKNLSNSN